MNNNCYNFKQQMLCDGKAAAEATFVATCVPTEGGRPFIPDELAAHLASGTPCSCYMPDCVRCLGGDVDATTKPLTGIVAANEVPRCRTPAVKKARR